MILSKALAVVKKDVKTALRYRSGFVFTAAAQAAQFGTFYYLARAIGPQFHPEGMPYFLFLVVGTGFYTFLFAGVHSFLRSIQESQQTGTMEVLLTTSTSAPLLVALSALSAFASGFLQFVFVLGACFFVSHPMVHPNIAACAVVFLLSMFITLALGLFAAGLQISMHKGSALLWLLGSGAWLMSGTLFPISALPSGARFISQCVPFTHSLAAMRLALVAGNSAGLIHEVELLAGYSLLLVPAAIVFFSRMVQQARQNGALSFY
jgi:ABC-2 type transport system permease protein